MPPHAVARKSRIVFTRRSVAGDDNVPSQGGREALMFTGKKISIIGGGNMGEVIAAGIVSAGLIPATDLTVTDVVSGRLDHLKKHYGIAVSSNNKSAVKGADIVIVAVKPQVMGSVLSGLASAVTKSTLVISIAAGIPVSFIEGYLKKGTPVVRVMPNTPALIGEGAAALAAGTAASDADLGLATKIFDSVGLTVTVNEELMDAVTGLSGSGPAYGFIIIEALSDAGVKMGLTRDVSLKLAAQTMAGAARLCLTGDRHPGQLKDMVTSPGGTTIAGVKALEEGKLRATLMDAVEAATLRSKELGTQK